MLEILSNPERYECFADGISEFHNGELVLYEDYAFLRDRHTALVEAVRGLLGSLDNGEFKTTITHSVAAEMAEKVYRINRDEVERLVRIEQIVRPVVGEE